jgi:DNA-binding HxlR family transcriptional regulator
MRLLDGAGERREPRLPTRIRVGAAVARLDYSAPFQHALELIGKRWTGAVIRALLPGPARFNALLMGIPGSSDRVLTERLRELEAEGLLERLVESKRPIKVRYRLTDRGRALAPVFAALDAWAAESRPRCSR